MSNRGFFLLAFALIFLVFLIPMKDTDFGWHYRCGEQIVKQGKLCTANNFTTLLEGYRWHSPAHLYQIVVYFFFNFFGFGGLTILYATLSSAVFTLFLLNLKGKLEIKLPIFIILLATAWSVFSLGFRSQVLTAYFFVLFLSLIERSKTNLKALYFLPILTLIWANAHPGFFLSVIILSLLLLAQLVNYLTGRLNPRELLIIFRVFCLTLLASLINPYGYLIYSEAGQHLKTPLNQLIVEWVAPPPPTIYLVLSLGLGTAILLLTRRKRDVFRILLTAFLTYLAVSARRNLMLFGLGLTFVLLEEEIVAVLERAINPWMRRLFWLILSFTLIFFFIQKNLGKSSWNEKDYCQRAIVPLPCQAVNLLKNKKPGNVFNAYEWGGYLAWKLPQFKHFLDGRMPSWNTTSETKLPPAWRGKSPYTIYLEVMYAVPEWRRIMAAYDIQYLLIEPKYPLYQLLEKEGKDTGFEKIYNDATALIYRRI